jgi:hypothetical protein
MFSGGQKAYEQRGSTAGCDFECFMRLEGIADFADFVSPPQSLCSGKATVNGLCRCGPGRVRW